ncbi:MAG: hypothetical protein A4E66_00584 [Syntrophus sp. PtaB.Bin001]|nr:MAG: hypothetical protein A4E66_00584 [Syntrophus sp. PtaB.Bin001]
MGLYIQKNEAVKAFVGKYEDGRYRSQKRESMPTLLVEVGILMSVSMMIPQSGQICPERGCKYDDCCGIKYTVVNIFKIGSTHIMSRERVNRRQKDISRVLREKKRFVNDKTGKNRKKKA